MYYHQSVKSCYLASLLKQFQQSQSGKYLNETMGDNIQQKITSQRVFHFYEKYILYNNFFKKIGRKSLKLYKVI